MVSKKQALGVYRAAGFDTHKAFEDEISAYCDRTSRFLLPDISPKAAASIRRMVKASGSPRQSINSTMAAYLAALHGTNTDPLIAALGFHQTLTTAAELTQLRFGDGSREEFLPEVNGFRQAAADLIENALAARGN